MTRPSLDPLAAPSQPREGLWAAPNTPAAPRAPQAIQAALEPMRFGGETFDPTRDGARLTSQLKAVEAVMQESGWVSLTRLVEVLLARYGIRATEASVSARLRDLRKPEFGGYRIERRHEVNGLWVYRMNLGGTQ